MDISFEKILQRIENADDCEINAIMDAVRKRFSVAFPDWEVIYLSCPRHNTEQRQQILDFLFHHFQSSDIM